MKGYRGALWILGLSLLWGGGAVAQWTPRPTATPRPIPQPTATPRPTIPPTPTPTRSPAPTPTRTPAGTPTPLPTGVPPCDRTPLLRLSLDPSLALGPPAIGGSLVAGPGLVVFGYTLGAPIETRFAHSDGTVAVYHFVRVR